MGDVTTSSSSSVPANPDVNPTVSKLLKGLQGAYDSGVKVYGKNLYPGVSDTTRSGWDAILGAANNADYAGGIRGAIADYADIASGNRFGMNDPGYAALRQGVIDDTMKATNASFDSAGLFGSDSNREAAGRGVAQAVAGLDYGNFQNDQQRQQTAISSLPGLYSALLAPGSAIGSVGSAMDTDALAQRQGENDLFRRQNDGTWDALARASSILNGTAGSAGTTSSTTIPWWQALLGGAATIGGLLG